MRCRQIRPLISQFFDQTLPSSEAAQVERHLAECPSCATFHRELGGVVGLLRASPPGRLSPGFTAQVMQRMQAESIPRTTLVTPWWRERLWITPRRLAAGSLALAVTAAVAFVCLRPRAQMGPEAQSFVQECMADYELYASVRPLAEKTPASLGTWGTEGKKP
jgi:anti-sigma factor RsiW